MYRNGNILFFLNHFRGTLRWLGHVLRMSQDNLLIESQGLHLDGLPKGKESKTYQKPSCEEQSRKRLRQLFSQLVAEIEQEEKVES